MHKALSAAEAIKHINSRVQVTAITAALTASNALSLLSDYDLILDCTDNLPTRYLLSDTAVRLGRPLISGAAQQFDGQLCTYNRGPGEGPCFRCLFPKPPAPELAGSCEELGVLGAVTGVIGNLQALEAIKIITGLHDRKSTMLIYSALSTPPFRTIRLRSRRPTCPACGNEREKVGTIEEMDYAMFCGGERPDWVSRGLIQDRSGSRIRAKELKNILDSGKKVRIVDVRQPTEFGICHLPGSTNIPIKELVANPSLHIGQPDSRTTLNGDGLSDEPSEDLSSETTPMETYVICRLGNDSRIAVDALRSAGATGMVKDLVGGLRAWAMEVDETFPVY
ncbi:uncharacterized protein LAESUDRAFT_732764 [Laetiporus sulphureus 93-53]|uniref:Rhodanese domain-containing protein n=1 Tax=Laetiporus sulphureus 93-53 TaxID=1314785 RepID=A0A165AZ48_9APHY|nr:uncharacterized protein LAESUDRAFT_732764 [Laetiporus sulphureus 93-53]KZS99927.1 hypothetical protein LAESUDRAFT_732764 [Laetiporus sulphureus 93-53]